MTGDMKYGTAPQGVELPAIVARGSLEDLHLEMSNGSVDHPTMTILTENNSSQLEGLLSKEQNPLTFQFSSS